MSDRIRVMTANLWNGGADPDGFAELVQNLEADVVCVQELSPEQAEALGRVLPYGCLEPDRNHDGQGIALRRPAEMRRVELPRRDAHVAELGPAHWPGLAAPLEVIAVHVMGPHVPPWVTAWPVRRGQLHGLLRYLDATSPRPRALVGDLNATPSGRSTGGWPGGSRTDPAKSRGAGAPGRHGRGDRHRTRAACCASTMRSWTRCMWRKPRSWPSPAATTAPWS